VSDGCRLHGVGIDLVEARWARVEAENLRGVEVCHCCMGPAHHSEQALCSACAEGDDCAVCLVASGG